MQEQVLLKFSLEFNGQNWWPGFPRTKLVQAEHGVSGKNRPAQTGSVSEVLSRRTSTGED